MRTCSWSTAWIGPGDPRPPYNLFIEDAIQETTTSTAGVSAEYGRFTGGVVNVITKSGGNELHGSFRDNLTNQDWTGARPSRRSADGRDQPRRYEATLGGPDPPRPALVLRRRTRYRDATHHGHRPPHRLPFESASTTSSARGQADLFAASATGASAPTSTSTREHATFFQTHRHRPREPLRHVRLPQDLMPVNYTGVLTDNFFVEAQYSERSSPSWAPARSSPTASTARCFVDLTATTLAASPTFCGVCRPEERNNENLPVKASYFLSTDTSARTTSSPARHVRRHPRAQQPPVGQRLPHPPLPHPHRNNAALPGVHPRSSASADTLRDRVEPHLRREPAAPPSRPTRSS